MENLYFENCFRSELLQLFNKGFYDNANNSNPSFVWHYTDSKGLCGILNDGSCLIFRFTDKDYFNDSTEGKTIEDVYIKCCKELLDSKQISRPFYDMIKDAKPRARRVFYNPNSNAQELLGDKYKYYVSCFSADGDSCYMWKNHAQNCEGYSMKLSTIMLSSIHNEYSKECSFSNLQFGQVIYDNEKKMEKLKEGILDAFRLYAKYEYNENADYLPQIKNYLIHYLTLVQMFFKINHYSPEKEYRLVLAMPYSMKSETIPIEFRKNSNGEAVPFVGIRVDKNCLKEVKRGPQNKESEEELKKLIKEKDISNCEISTSRLKQIYKEQTHEN